MITHAKISESGEILCTVSYAVPEDADKSLVLIELPDGKCVSELYVRDGKVLERGTAPSAIHRWVDFNWVKDTKLALEAVKIERARKLWASDWTQLPDAPEAKRAEWATYRQDLRDITKQEGFPLEVEWPIEPT